MATTAPYNVGLLAVALAYMNTPLTPHQKTLLARDWLAQRVIGQKPLLDRLFIALLTGGHLLVEGAPGLAKTRAIKELSRVVEAEFHRIQFTPDLLPSDVTGSEIFNAEQGTFRFEPGPIFHNLVLADEINRAPAKVQSALLEAMAEHQVSYGRKTFPLPDLFLVMATQNPIEQEGTYPLPEAQLDRFLLQVLVSYPDAAAEQKILRMVRGESLAEGDEAPPLRLNSADVFAARRQIMAIHMAPPVEEYIVQLVVASRNGRDYSDELGRFIAYGASPRGSIAIDQCSRAAAWLEGRDFVTPEDVQNVAHDTLRHRLILTFEADANDVQPDAVIDQLLQRVPAP